MGLDAEVEWLWLILSSPKYSLEGPITGVYFYFITQLLAMMPIYNGILIARNWTFFGWSSRADISFLALSYLIIFRAKENCSGSSWNALETATHACRSKTSVKLWCSYILFRLLAQCRLSLTLHSVQPLDDVGCPPHTSLWLRAYWYLA